MRPPEPRAELFRTNPAFRRLFASRAISFTGDGAALVALILYVKQTRDSGVAVAALLLASSLPRLLGPLFGALADRIDRRTIMVVCDVGQAAVFGAIAAFLPSWPVFLALVTVSGILTAAFVPAGHSAVPGLVADAHLPAANAWIGTAFNLQVAVGPLLGGVLVSTLGVRGALAVDAGTFVLSALLLAGLPRAAAEAAAPAQRLLADVKAGLGFVRRHAVARAVVVTLGVGVSFGALDNVALVFLARDELGASAIEFGVVNAAFGIGMVVAALALLRLGVRFAPRNLVVAGWLLTGLGTLATGLSPAIAFAIGAQALAGMGNGTDNVASDTLIQRTVPREMLGRVFGLTGTAAYLASGLAYAAGGPLLNVVSPRTVMVIAGAGALFAFLLAAVLLPRDGEGTNTSDA